MDLKDFALDRKQLVDNFVADYSAQRKKGKQATMIRPEGEWVELFNEYVESHSDATVL